MILVNEMFYIQTLENRFLGSKAEIKQLHDENTDCEFCQTANSIIFDEERGDYICTNCGMVHSEKQITMDYYFNGTDISTNLVSKEKSSRNHLNMKYDQLINSHLNKQPQDVKRFIKRYVDIFSSVITIKQSMINDVEHYLMKVPPQYFHIKNTEGDGFRFYEVLLTIFYYLYSKKIGFKIFRKTLREYGVMLSLRRMREIKYKLECEHLFQKDVFNLVSMDKFEKETDVSIKKMIIQQTTSSIKAKFYTDMEIGLKQYFERLDFNCLKRVKKQELKTCNNIHEYRKKLVEKVYQKIVVIPYIELVRFRPPSIFASMTYITLRSYFKKDYIAKAYKVTEATISNLMVKLKNYI